VSHGKVDVEHSNELGVSLEDIPDTLSSKGLFPESGLDLVQNLLVAGLGLIKHCTSVVLPFTVLVTYHS
jgi:hypothetical protein